MLIASDPRRVAYLIDIFCSEFVLPQQLVRRQVEYVQSVGTSLNSRFTDSYRSSIQYPEPVARICMDPVKGGVICRQSSYLIDTSLEIRGVSIYTLLGKAKVSLS